MKFYIRKSFAAVAIFTTLCMIENSANAFSPGSKASGMGSTGIAYPQDAFAGAYNPAGIVDIGDRIDLGFGWTRERSNAEVFTSHKSGIEEVNNTFQNSTNLYNGEFGINKVFYTNACGWDWDWAAGIVGYNQDYSKTSYEKPVRLLGRTKTGLEHIHEIISPIISLRLNQCHTVGISLDLHLQRIKINGLQQFSNPRLSSSPAHVTNRGHNYSSGLGISLGWKWEASEALTLGATYHSKTSMRKFHKYKGLLAGHGEFNSPERYGLGLAYQYLPVSTLTFDVEWINWHDIKSLHNPLFVDGHKAKLGSKDGSGFGYRNELIFRIGIDYALNESWLIRMGYKQTNLSLRSAQTMLNILTCHTIENFLTLGFTFSWRSNEITAYFEHGFENTVHGKRAIPDIFGKGSVALTESNNTLGISWGYIF